MCGALVFLAGAPSAPAPRGDGRARGRGDTPARLQLEAPLSPAVAAPEQPAADVINCNPGVESCEKGGQRQRVP